MPANNQLLAMIPALAVAALDALVREAVQDGRLSPGGGFTRPVQQTRDIRRALMLTREAHSAVHRTTQDYHCYGRQAADLARMNEAASQSRAADALYHAAWYGWYGDEVSASETPGEGGAR